MTSLDLLSLLASSDRHTLEQRREKLCSLHVQIGAIVLSNDRKD